MNNNLKKSPKNEEDHLYQSSSKLKLLARELDKVKKTDRKLFSKMMKLFNKEPFRFADYISKNGKMGIKIAKNAARWANKKGRRPFREDGNLISSFLSLRGLIEDIFWDGHLKIRSELEYAETLRKIINDPNSKRIMWAAPSLSCKIKPRLGYLYKRMDKKMILIVIDDEGYVENIGVGIPWGDIKKQMLGFYKVDDFDEGFHPYY